MSAALFWRPDGVGDNVLSVGPKSRFIDSMNKTFGTYPWKLNGEHVPQLRAMASVDDQEPSPYAELVQIIGRVDGIVLWPEY